MAVTAPRPAPVQATTATAMATESRGVTCWWVSCACSAACSSCRHDSRSLGRNGRSPRPFRSGLAGKVCRTGSKCSASTMMAAGRVSNFRGCYSTVDSASCGCPAQTAKAAGHCRYGRELAGNKCCSGHRCSWRSGGDGPRTGRCCSASARLICGEQPWCCRGEPACPRRSRGPVRSTTCWAGRGAGTERQRGGTFSSTWDPDQGQRLLMWRR